MKPFTQRITLLLLISLSKAQAITVLDPINLVQNAMSALSEMSQQIKQVQQYTTQLQELATASQQLQDMVQNSQSLQHFNWDDSQGTISKLIAMTDTIGRYKDLMGDINHYTDNFQSVDFYRNSPCIGIKTCTETDRAQLAESTRIGSEAKKQATDALIRGIDQQQQALIQDTHQLKTLQHSAQSATGRLQALQAANQLASEQSHQLMQIRGLLLAQANALATQMAVQNDQEARASTLEETFKSGIYSSAKPIGY